MADANVSHGRGGAGNMVPDETPQVLHRADVQDLTNKAIAATLMVKSFVRARQVIKVMAHTLQRGGAGNIESPRTKATKPGSTHDSDIIPETALHEPGADHEKYHVGRGGEGNVHLDQSGTTHKGLADKLKDKMFKKSPK